MNENDNENDQSREVSRLVAKAFEPAAEKLKTSYHLTDAELGFGLLGLSMQFLARSEDGPAIVARLVGLAAAMADVHGIDPETGEHVTGSETTRQ